MVLRHQPRQPQCTRPIPGSGISPGLTSSGSGQVRVFIPAEAATVCPAPSPAAAQPPGVLHQAADKSAPSSQPRQPPWARHRPRQRHSSRVFSTRQRTSPAPSTQPAQRHHGRQALAAPKCGRHIHRKRPAAHLHWPHPLDLIFSFIFFLFFLIFYFCFP
jgi:hypothetical protein